MPVKTNTLKVSQLLFPYLKQNGTLHLQGLGAFTYEPSAEPADANNKNAGEQPVGTIVFVYDKKCPTDEGLIAYISKETGKIKPLASSDVESFIEIGKQLLNISKPFVLEGMGSLYRNAQGELLFTQDLETGGDEEIPGKKAAKPSVEESVHFDNNYMRPDRRKSSAGTVIVAASLFIIGIGLIGLVAWYLYNQSQSAAGLTDSSNEIKELVLSQPPMDSSSQRLSEDSLTEIRVPADTVLKTSVTEKVEGFNLVLEVSRKNRALKRYADLKEWGHKVVLSTSDSVLFKLAIPVRAPLADSSRHRDSLSAFFGKKVWIETN